MSLIVWCGASVQALKDVFGPVISQHDISHRVEPNMTFFPSSVVPGDVVVACGTKALNVLQDMKVFPKNRTIGSLREKLVEVNGVRVFITYDPGIVARDYGRLPEIQWDVQLAIRLVKTGSTFPTLGRVHIVESFHELMERVEELHATTGKPVRLSCDLETIGLDEWDPEAWILSISFTIEPGISYVMYFRRNERPLTPEPWANPEGLGYWQGVWYQINWLLTTDLALTCGANFKFDSKWMVGKWGIYCTNHKFDTMLVGSLLNENRSNSLKLHAKIMTPLGGYEAEIDKFDKARMDLIPKPVLCKYNGVDTDACWRVAEVMRSDLLQDKALTRFYVELLHPASKVFEKLERNGVAIDVPYYRALQQELETEATRLHDEMIEMLPTRIKGKYFDSLKITRPALLKEFLFTKSGLNLTATMFTEKTKEPSTSMDHLMQFESDPEAGAFIKLYKEFGSCTKMLSTFVVGFLNYTRSDGRLHPVYQLHRGDYEGSDSGTVSGRLSATAPAIQCQTGGSIVYTLEGNQTLLSIVEGYEAGNRYRVLTHTGRWREVVGVYRNGVKPVFRVTLTDGKFVDCTANHPLLSSMGFVRTDHLYPGDSVFTLGDWDEKGSVRFDGAGFREVDSVALSQGREEVGVSMLLREPSPGVRADVEERINSIVRVLEVGAVDGSRAQYPSSNLSDLQRLGTHDPEMYQSKSQGLLPVWREGHSSVREVEELLELSGGYGGGSQGEEHRSLPESGRGLRAGELSMGYPDRAGSQPANQQEVDVKWGDANFGGMAGGDWVGSQSPLPLGERVECGSGSYHAQEAASAGFVLADIVSIEYVGEEETFDLTIEGCHSFVSNGIVVHNTLPKHNKWAKKLRRAFVAPPGYNILNLDFGQGELRIAAVIAEEPIMLDAYKNNLDLHSITAARASGHTLEDFLTLEDDVREELRFAAKSMNFG